MAHGRTGRHAKVLAGDRDKIEQAAVHLVDAMRNANMRLVAFNEHYSALH